MSASDVYKLWANSAHITEDERAELMSIAENANEIEARFFAPLSFGTAGLRGVMGMGLNRMNVYVVRHTTQALANLILQEGQKAMRDGVAIAYDCRHNARAFAEAAACVLAGNGIRAFLFDALRPTPELSFAIRHGGHVSGINITASHNPREYNGYKVYWRDGAQLPPEHAAVVAREMERIDPFTDVKSLPMDEALGHGLITWLGDACDEAFLSQVLQQSVAREDVDAVADTLKIVYTPFHGTGVNLVPRVLRDAGVKHVLCVPEQMVVDGDFPTVASPNPENTEGFALAIELARRENVDLCIGTDPDADRVGLVVRDRKGEYRALTGNQIGVLLMDFLVRARREKGTLPANPAVVKSIVTTDMVGAVGAAHGVTVLDTFTGFKFIAEAIAGLEQSGSHHYIFAFEESNGFLAGDHARDKDAVVTSMLLAEMAAWYTRRGQTLAEALEALYETYGHFREETLNLIMPGLSGMAQMEALMRKLREAPPEKIAEWKVSAVRDYLSGERLDRTTGQTEPMALKSSNVLFFELEDGSSFIVRPSGTEPKIKVYLLVRGDTADAAGEKIRALKAYAKTLK